MAIGENIRMIRQSMNMTIPQIAEASGLSRGFLSQIENDKVSLSLESLEKIADALGRPMRDLLPKESNPPVVVRKADRLIIQAPGSPRMEMLSALYNKQLQVMSVTVPAGFKGGGAGHIHEGEEFILVQRGCLKICQEDFETTVCSGDSIHLESTTPHSWFNESEEEVSLLVVCTPPAELPSEE